MLVWKALLEKYGYDDLVLFMQESVELVGVHDAPSCYPAMLKPAALTLEVWRFCNRPQLGDAVRWWGRHPKLTRLMWSTWS